MFIVIRLIFLCFLFRVVHRKRQEVPACSLVSDSETIISLTIAFVLAQNVPFYVKEYNMVYVCGQSLL